MSKFYRFIYRVLWVLMKLIFPWKCEGEERLPDSGGFVMCANHTSFLDPVLVLLSATNRRQIHVIAKAELFQIPVLSLILKRLEMIPVKRGMSDITAVKESLRVLRNGAPLLIFPEGTRVKKGERIEGRPGAVVMAARANVPMVPVYITEKKKMFRITKIVFGEPYMLEFSGRKPTPEESHTLTKDLMERIYGLGEVK